MTETESRAASQVKNSGDATTLRRAVQQLVRLLRLIRPYWRQLCQGMVLAVVVGLFSLATPYITKLLIDEVYPTEDVSLLHVLVLGFLVLNLASALLSALHNVFNLHVNIRMGSATRLLFFNHLQHLQARFFDQHQVGEINSRFRDVGAALQTITKIFQTFFIQSVYLLLVPPILFFLEWRLALVSLVSLPLIMAVAAYTGRWVRRFFKRSAEASADLDAFQIETLTHIHTFKTMGLEHQAYRRAEALTTHAMEQQLRAGGLSQAINAGNMVLHGMNTVLFTWFGWTLILARQMTLGDYIAFSAYIGYLYNPLQRMIEMFADFQQAAVHLNRMFEYLDAPVEQEPRLAYAPPRAPEHLLSGAFRLQNVHFDYGDGRSVLRDFDLSIPAHKVCALIGPSGSGKTSLLRLLVGLDQPSAGSITIDGFPLAPMRIADLRQQLAVVWQDVGLLSGSLWDNLVLGADQPTPAEVDRVSRLCGLGPVLDDLPDGYATHVAEGGASLSAGQRQRVALARAVLRRAPILLLDEATANIDVETEMDLLQSVFRELRGTTIVLVTHRMASAALADQICVLGRGTVEGFGSHRELLEGCIPYQRMVSASAGAASFDPRFGRLAPPATQVAS